MLLLYCSQFYQRGKNALMWAAHNGNLEVVVKLAELGVDLAVADNVSNIIYLYFRMSIVLIHSGLVDHFDSC